MKRTHNPFLEYWGSRSTAKPAVNALPSVENVVEPYESREDDTERAMRLSMLDPDAEYQKQLQEVLRLSEIENNPKRRNVETGVVFQLDSDPNSPEISESEIVYNDVYDPPEEDVETVRTTYHRITETALKLQSEGPPIEDMYAKDPITFERFQGYLYRNYPLLLGRVTSNKDYDVALLQLIQVDGKRHFEKLNRWCKRKNFYLEIIKQSNPDIYYMVLKTPYFALEHVARNPYDFASQAILLINASTYAEDPITVPGFGVYEYLFMRWVYLYFDAQITLYHNRFVVHTEQDEVVQESNPLETLRFLKSRVLDLFVKNRIETQKVGKYVIGTVKDFFIGIYYDLDTA